MKTNYVVRRIHTPALKLEYFLVPWDTTIFAFPVGQIERIAINDPIDAGKEFSRFESWMKADGIRLASCRLGHDRLKESMFLESRGFRFVEMLYPLRLDGIDKLEIPHEGIEFALAEAADLDEIQEIARYAFVTGRFNVDPRLDAELGGRRYAAWVDNSFSHASQHVYKVLEGDKIAAFFITESLSDGRAYWHLTAVAPAFQGHGIGKRAWRAMIRLNKGEGARQIETMISVRNTPVVNLYVDMHFRFQPPLMTLHRWQE